MFLLHDENVAEVQRHHRSSFVPIDIAIIQDSYQNADRDQITGAITSQWPPGELNGSGAEKAAKTDNDQNVENGGSDNGSSSDVGFRNENT